MNLMSFTRGLVAVAVGGMLAGSAVAEDAPPERRLNGPAGFLWCAAEGESFALSGTNDVAYGVDGKFTYLFNQTGIVTFTSQAFGHDPTPGARKAGFFKRSGPLADPLGILRKPIPDKLVVLTFDDGCSTHATYVAPLLKSLGFGGSFYLCTLPSFGNKNWYMSWEQMQAMVKDGFEIGNHTRHHTVGSGIEAFLDMERETVCPSRRPRSGPATCRIRKPLPICRPTTTSSRGAVIFGPTGRRWTTRSTFPHPIMEKTWRLLLKVCSRPPMDAS